MEAADEGRSARKHRAIMQAAATVFLDKGYPGTSMEDIARLAGVSKQTVYKHFTDKQSLFTEIVLSTTGEIDAMVNLVADLRATNPAELETELTTLASSFVHAVMHPEVLRLRRLVIANADHFPDLGATWYAQGFERVLTTLAASFTALADQGLLKLQDSAQAAEHFAALVLWIPVNRAMFHGTDHGPAHEDLDHYATSAALTFLAAYHP